MIDGIKNNANAGFVKSGPTKDENSNDKLEFKRLLREKTDDAIEKIRTGNTEPTYQIGSASFTEKEWDKLIEKVDKNLEKVKKEQEQEKEEAIEEKALKEKAEALRCMEEEIKEQYME